MSLRRKYIALHLIFFMLVNLIPQSVGAFSVGEEKEVGERLMSMVRKSFHVIDDPDVSQYVNILGQQILTVAGPQYFDYHFFVINDKEFNAFAAPSGLIFIHSGLIEAMENEGELISVMAHEVGHVTSRHIADRLNKSAKASLGTVALLLAGIAMGGGALSQAVVTGSMAANASMSLKFSREDEEEADRLSFKWMRELKSDPQDMESMLRKMYRVSVYRSANIPPYLLTHPEPKQRMGYVEDLISNAQPEKYSPRDNFPFLRIKQRVLTMSREPATLQAQFTRQATEDKGEKGVMAKYGLAMLAEAGADYAKAETLLKEVIQAYPNRLVLQTDLAALYLQANRRQEALGLLTMAHGAEPNNAYTTYTLAQAMEQNGDRQKALQLFRDLETVIPDHAMLQRTIGNLETQFGHKGMGTYYLARYFWLEGDAKNAKQNLKVTIMDTGVDQATLAKAKVMLDDIERIEKDR